MAQRAERQALLTDAGSVRANMWILLGVSAVSLFLELALIRWISTEVRIFAYLQSSVLVVCLMGLGMGCFASSRAIDLRRLMVPLTVIVALLTLPVTYEAMGNLSAVLARYGNFHIWGVHDTFDMGVLTNVSMLAISLLLVGLLLFLVWISFIPLGQIVARLIDGHDNTVTAYSVNIVGSFLGIALFTGMSAAALPPLAWFGLLSVCFAGLVLLDSRHRKLNGALVLAIPVLVGIGSLNASGTVTWSPYQKLALNPEFIVDAETGEAYEQRVINVNNIGYQAALDLRPQTTTRYPDLFDPELAGMTQYDLPVMFKPQAESVLIVGAGSGNDVAGALRGGAKAVTAVEIDPAIIAFGKRHHPEAPYDDPRVTVVNDDARSFMARTRQTYDLIVFGLLDSHTAGPMTNARLDHYVYTAENIHQAKALLKPGGVMFLAFEANKPYLVDRMNAALEEVFGAVPMKFRVFSSNYGFGGAMFVAGDQEAIEGALAGSPRLAAYVQDLQDAYAMRTSGQVEVITDDWPYLYLEERSIPVLYAFLGAILLSLYLLAGRFVGLDAPIKGWRMGDWHFFFLGAAFMLLEVHMIAKSAVVLGSVWTVNAVIIGGIMGMILIANLIKAKVRRLPTGLVFALLMTSCAGLYAFDLSVLASIPYVQKALIIGAVGTVPILFGGLVFIHSFDSVADKGRALGANLFGALVGGMLQIVTFVTGMQFLMILVGGLYVAALITARGVQAEWARQPAE